VYIFFSMEDFVMGLYPCPKCGHTISTEARQCPQCGLQLTVSQPGYNQQGNNQPRFNQPGYNRQGVNQPGPYVSPRTAPAAPEKKSKGGKIALIVSLCVVGAVALVLGILLLTKNGKSEPEQYYNAANDDLDLGKKKGQSADVFSVNLEVYLEKNMDINPLSDYNVDVLVDGNIHATLGNGQTFQTKYPLSLAAGVHTIRFQNNEKSSTFKEITVTIDSDTTLRYSVKRTALGKLEVSIMN